MNEIVGRSNVSVDILDLLERLTKIEAKLDSLIDRQTVKEHYSVDEFAAIVKRESFTCREWARLGRIHASKKASGRGAHAQWVVSHTELLRYQKEGLLPLRRVG